MKWILKFLLFIVATTLISIAIFSFWIRTDDAKATIIDLAENMLSTQLGFDVDIEDVDVLPFVLIDIYNITISEPIDEKNFEKDEGKGDEKILSIDKLHINIPPSLTLFQEINIWQIVADSVRIHKAPSNRTQESVQEKNKQYVEAGWFNPDIILHDIIVKELVFDPSSTNQKEDLSLSISARGLFDSDRQKLNFVSETSFLSPSLESMGENSLELSGKYELTKELLSLKQINFKSAILELSGELMADIGNDQVSGKLNYKSTDVNKNHSEYLQYFSQILSEDSNEIKRSDIKLNFSGEVELSGKVSALEIKNSGNVNLDLPKNDYFNYYPFSYQSNFTVKNDEIGGSLKIIQEEVIANLNLKYRDGKLSIDQLKAEADNFVKTANLVFDFDKRTINGRAKFTDKNLQQTAKYFPFIWSGAADIDMIFSSTKDFAQELKIIGKIKRLNMRYGSYGYIDLDLNIVDLWNLSLTDSFCKIRSFEYAGIAAREIKTKLKYVNDELVIKSNVIAGQPYPFDLVLLGKIKQDKEQKQWHINISDLSGKLRDVEVKQNREINIFVGANNSVSMPELFIGKGIVSLDGKIEDGNIDATLNLEKIPTLALPEILPDIFDQSVFDSNIVFSEQLSNPKIKASLLLNKVNLDAGSKSLSIRANALQYDQKLNLETEFFSNDKIMGNAKFYLPLQCSLNSFIASFDQGCPLSGTIKINEKFDFISMIPLPVGHKAQGLLEGGFEMSGVMSNPKIVGNIALSEGKYSHKQYGVKLQNISGKIYMNNDNLSLKDFVAYDSYANKMSASGKLNLDENNDFSAQIDSDKLYLMNTRYLQGEIKGGLKINGNNKRALAKGAFDIGPLDIKIPEHFKTVIPEINVIETIEENHDVEKINKEPYELSLDIKINTNDKVYIRGWGVEAKLDGNLSIAGSANDPIIKGELKSQKGRYQEFGKILDITRAELSFDGPIDPSPYMNIVGSTTAGNTEIRLVLSGSIFNPDVSIESTPELPEETALSKLLFGDNPENISTFQALQLADGMRRLSGHGGGFDPMGVGRKILGVDQINFKSDSDNPENDSVGVGKHLSDKVYFEIERGSSDNSTKTKIEVQITPKISIENTIEQEGSASIGVNWRFDY